MKPPRAQLFRIAVVGIAHLALALVALGCAARGERAIERMSPDQREFVAHSLTSFSPRTTPLELEAAFGMPSEASSARWLWRRPGAAPGERIEAWFEGDRLVHLRVFDGGDHAVPGCSPRWTWDLIANGDRLVPLSPVSPASPVSR